MIRFREYVKLREELSIQDLVAMIVRALGGNPGGDNYEAKLTQFVEPGEILDRLNQLPNLQALIQNNPSALTAIQSNQNLTIGQLSGLLTNEQ